MTTSVLSIVQKLTAQDIVNIFETGLVKGDYASTINVPSDPGRLTYGRSQTTNASGNLYLLVLAYCEATGAVYANKLKPYLSLLKARSAALDTDMAFRQLLQDAGAKDPVMHKVQDTFFDRVYWQPAADRAAALGLKTALGYAIVYDGTVHGSFALIRDRVNQKYGTVAKIGEKTWLITYLKERRTWLANHSKKILRRCVYRMDELLALVTAGKWDLALNLLVRGLTISPQTMGIDIQAAPAPIPAPSTVVIQSKSNPSTPIKITGANVINEGGAILVPIRLAADALGWTVGAITRDAQEIDPNDPAERFGAKIGVSIPGDPDSEELPLLLRQSQPSGEWKGFVPLRDIAECANLPLAWDQEMHTATITA